MTRWLRLRKTAIDGKSSVSTVFPSALSTSSLPVGLKYIGPEFSSTTTACQLPFTSLGSFTSVAAVPSAGAAGGGIASSLISFRLPTTAGLPTWI